MTLANPIGRRCTVINGPYAKRFEVMGDQSNRITYEGFAMPDDGAKDKLVWAIRKYTYTGGNTQPDTIIWADGENTFDKTWSLRATYTY